MCWILLKIAVVTGKHIGLVDRPTERKNHRGEIPLVGGIGIFLTFLVLQAVSPASIALIIAGSLLLSIGIADDYLDLNPKSRLLFQGIAAGVLVIGGGYQIVSLGSIFSAEVLILTGIVSVVFSVVCIIGVINAINMIDGADCLAGSIVSVSILALMIIAGFQAEINIPLISGLALLLGATLVFLVFNSGAMGITQKVFLGDSGSMFLGIVLASYFIGMSQGDNAPLSPVVAGWIFGLPLMDSVSVMVRRALSGKSPLSAGRDHLHHRLIDNGLSSAQSVAIMLGLHVILVAIGIIGNFYEFSNQMMFWSFVSMTVAYHFIAPIYASPALLRVPRTNEQSVK